MDRKKKGREEERRKGREREERGQRWIEGQSDAFKILSGYLHPCLTHTHTTHTHASTHTQFHCNSERRRNNFILLSKPPFYESLIKTVVVNIRPEAEFLKDEEQSFSNFGASE